MAEISTILDARGCPKGPVTIAAVRSDFLGTYRALAKAGALKSPVALH